MVRVLERKRTLIIPYKYMLYIFLLTAFIELYRFQNELEERWETSSSEIRDIEKFKNLVEKIEESVLESSFQLAERESLEFFTDIRSETWKRLKARFQNSRPNVFTGPRKIFRDHSNNPTYFWSENYHPEFTCLNEERYGSLGDGGKYVCDSHRIEKKKCLVYSVGSRGDFTFEVDFKEKGFEKCEIHTFDRLSDFNGRIFSELAEKAGVVFHHISLGEPTDRVKHGKRFKDIIVDLKHEGLTIDIMKIDIEGSEWEQYQQWFDDWDATNVKVRQVLIELHKSPLPHVVEFFNGMLDRGYLIFHKEVNSLNAECVEFSFILLDKRFQTVE